VYPNKPTQSILFDILPFSLNEEIQRSTEPQQRQILPMLELIGYSSSGKTQLLYYIIANSVLPSRFLGRKLPGKQSSVVMISTGVGTGAFNVERLAQVMKNVINISLNQFSETQGNVNNHGDETIEPLSSRDVDALIHLSLEHVLVYRAGSLEAVDGILESLKQQLLDNESDLWQRTKMRTLSAIVIDSVSSFYWQNRAMMSVDKTRTIEGLSIDSTMLGLGTESMIPTSQLLSKLRSLANIFSCGVIMVSWLLGQVKFEFRTTESLPRDLWPKLPQTMASTFTARVISFQSPPDDGGFASDVSALEAWTSHTSTETGVESEPQFPKDENDEVTHRSSPSKFTVFIEGDQGTVRHSKFEFHTSSDGVSLIE
jgi:hypothetical protein